MMKRSEGLDLSKIDEQALEEILALADSLIGEKSMKMKGKPSEVSVEIEAESQEPSDVIGKGVMEADAQEAMNPSYTVDEEDEELML